MNLVLLVQIKKHTLINKLHRCVTFREHHSFIAQDKLILLLNKLIDNAAKLSNKSRIFRVSSSYISNVSSYIVSISLTYWFAPLYIMFSLFLKKIKINKSETKFITNLQVN